METAGGQRGERPTWAERRRGAASGGPGAAAPGDERRGKGIAGEGWRRGEPSRGGGRVGGGWRAEPNPRTRAPSQGAPPGEGSGAARCGLGGLG
jgi:hypothetical protein